MSITLNQGNIAVNLRPNNTQAAEKVVAEAARIEGPATIYCWYVGPEGLPVTGAAFMTGSIIRPLIEKKRDATVCLYSLEEWSFKRTASLMANDTEMTRAISLVNNAFIESLSSASFFEFCKEAREKEELCREISSKFMREEQLIKISERFEPMGLTIDEFYGREPTLFDAIKGLDLKRAYACMQYVEGYYLVRRLALQALKEGKTSVNAAFVLPGGEGKYYRGFSEDLPRWLKLDLGEMMTGLDIRVSFLFFKYLSGGETRPYLTSSGAYVQPDDVSRYLGLKEMTFSALGGV